MPGRSLAETAPGNDTSLILNPLNSRRHYPPIGLDREKTALTSQSQPSITGGREILANRTDWTAVLQRQ